MRLHLHFWCEVVSVTFIFTCLCFSLLFWKVRHIKRNSQFFFLVNSIYLLISTFAYVDCYPFLSSSEVLLLICMCAKYWKWQYFITWWGLLTKLTKKKQHRFPDRKKTMTGWNKPDWLNWTLVVFSMPFGHL